MGILAAALIVPAAALAGTFSWDLPANFTATPPGANPDHDNYGARPWSYEYGPSALLPATSPNPSTFKRLSTPPSGGTGWTDPNAPGAQIAVDSGGQLVMSASATRPVAVAWTSPFSSSRAVTVSYTVTSNSCPPPVLVDQFGGLLPATSVVPGGGTIYLVVSPPTIPLGGCSSAITSLHIVASTPAPTVTLANPAADAVITGGQPTFSGAASSGFGASPTVAVAVYPGMAASGTPAQRITIRRSGTTYSGAPTPALGDGTYTARAEQDDLAGGRGFSAAHTFTIRNVRTQVRGPVKIGPRVTISKSGRVTVPVKCLAKGFRVCAGDVLILTRHKFRPRPGGPAGRIRVLFAYVSIPAGRTASIKRSMPRDLAAFLRRRKFVALRLGSTLMAAGRASVAGG